MLWEGVAAPNLVGRSGEVTSSWACGLEGKKESGGQSKRESWEKESCRKEKKKKKTLEYFQQL